MACTLSAVVARDTLYDADVAALSMAQVVRRLLAPRQHAERSRLTAALEAAIREGDPATQRELLQACAALHARTSALDEALEAEDVVAS
ncbi:MAG: hypothetical protein H6736_12220 [Alphaproteobacteria bacterium]|nr:hypothetical protein [Alphaproteobacteria bacterium]